MCRRLGKKHPQFVGTEGLERQKHEKMIRAPHRSLCDSYMVCILNDHTNLREKLWPSQHTRKKNSVENRLTPSKRRYYAKLEHYYARSANGK